MRYTEEERLINHRKEKGEKDVLPFYEMDNEKFYDLLNTFRWLTKYNYNHIQINEEVIKPSNQSILEAMVIMKEDAEELLINAKKYPKGDLRNSLIKTAKKTIECSTYYTQLVQDDYYN